MRLLRLAVLGGALLNAGLGLAIADPPAAPKGETVDTLHGVAVKDPYRSLEDLQNPATRQWLKAQGQYAAEQLARIPERAAIQARIAELSDASGDVVREVVRMPGERIYYLKRAAGAPQFKLMMRIGLKGAERVLVDPEGLSKSSGVPHAINYFVPSWDGRTLAYGVSAGGSELRAPVPGEPESEKYKDSTVYWLKLGDDAAKARPLFGPLVNRELKLDRLDVAGIEFDPASRHMIARTTDTTAPEGKLFVAPVSALKAPAIAWRQISGFDDKITAIALRRDTLYLRTYADAPRGRVVALDLAKPELKNARTVVPEPASGVLLDFHLGRDALYAEVREGFTVRLVRHAGTTPTDVPPMLAGSAFAVDDAAHAYRDVYFATSAWTEPSRILRATARGGLEDTHLRQARMPAGAPALAVTEVKVPSHDGAPVPLAIVHKKGLVLDGSNPTLLIGYGAYGFSFEARFDPRNLAWLERGGVIAFANVRGSGAYGDPWYRAGFKTTKPNTWKDGIGCARYLIAQRYASPQTLGVWGTSAGGIFVGRSVTTAPELFAAAIFDVGIMDAVRGEESANGATNVSEFGTVKDAQEFRALLEMSTYHQIKDGVAYPAVLLVHGMNDPRVDVWHSAKAAARLQAASTSGRPVLLRLDEQAGHGVGSTAQQTYGKLADVYSFLLWQFGKLSVAP
jgi:prolyl oligopeptidase